MPTTDELLCTFCHHRPDRLLHLFGADSVLCARCSGIYLGWLAAAAVLSLAWRRSAPSARKGLLTGLSFVLIAVVPLEVAAEHFLSFDPGNLGRYFTGAALGCGFAVLLLVLADDMKRAEGRNGTKPASLAAIPPALAAGAFGPFLLFVPPVFNLLVFAGLAGVYLHVNGLLSRALFGLRGLGAYTLAAVLTVLEWSALYLVNNHLLRG